MDIFRLTPQKCFFFKFKLGGRTKFLQINTYQGPVFIFFCLSRFFVSLAPPPPAHTHTHTQFASDATDYKTDKKKMEKNNNRKQEKTPRT